MAESITQYETVAGERLFDPLAIALTPGRETSGGSVYLLGYVVEMVLKAAFFRATGANPVQPVSFSSMAAMLGKRLLKAHEKHDLGLLLNALVAARTSIGNPHPPALSGQLTSLVGRAKTAWSVDQRYDPASLPETVVSEMYNDAAWIFSQRLAIG